MISDSIFPVEPWVLRETRFDPDMLPQSESMFALSNGHIGMRGNLDEGEIHLASSVVKNLSVHLSTC